MLIQIKCQNCGSNIKVENNNKKYVCDHCGAEFVLEETINNFQTVNQYHTTQNIVKNIYGNESMDVVDIVKNGDVFVSLGEFDKAEKLYNQAINKNPADWHGWFGLVKVKTKDFSDLDDITHCDFLIKAKKVASEEQKEEINNLYSEYKLKREQKKSRIEKQRQEELIEREKRIAIQKQEEEKINKKKKIGILFIGLVFIVGLIISITRMCYISIEEKADLEARNGLILQEKEDYYLVTGIEQFNENIVIPTTYKGKEIKEFEANVFSGNDNIKSITISDSITSIGDHAFSGCDSLTSVVIGNSVTSIGDYAFSSCYSLTSITVDENNPNYKSIDGNLYSKDGKTLIQYAIGKTATTFVISNSVANICDYAFEDCTSLTSIEIPNSVTSIGDYAFRNCPIEKATIPTIAISYIPKGELKEVVITSGESIGGQAFHGCTSLKSIEIPNSVKSIGYYAFYNCKSLKSVKIPDSVTSIGEQAFAFCNSLTNIEIPNSVTSIGDGAFSYCNSLRSIVIPNSVTSIGDGAFAGCDSLEYNISDGLKYLGNSENQYLYLAGVVDGNITTATINNNCKFIGYDAFYECTSLTSVLIPNSVTSIGNSAFYGCDSLTSVTIGNNVTSIGDWAFYGCDSLTSIEIPDSVTSIGNYAFMACFKLKSINYNGTIAEWNSISKGSDWAYNVDATVYCTDGNIII